MKKIFIFLLLGLFMISLVSAFEFDNQKHYNEETNTITINNCALWAITCLIEGDKIADIQLLSPQNILVPQGNQKVAELKLTNFDREYVNAFSDMNFYQINQGMQKFDRTFEYKYKSNETEQREIMEEVCEGTGNQTVCKLEETGEFNNYTKEIWVSFSDLEELPNEEEIIFGIFTNVQRRDYVEWIPRFFGMDIEEWATWTTSLSVNLDFYYKFDEISGTNVQDFKGNYSGTAFNIEDGDWEIGKIGNALHLDGINEYINTTFNPNYTISDDFSFSFWAKVNVPTVSSDNHNYLGSLSATSEIRVQGRSAGNSRFRIIDGATLNCEEAINISTGEFVHLVVVRDTSADEFRYYINGTNEANCTDTMISNVDFSDKPVYLGALNSMGTASNFLNVTIDEFAWWSRSLSQEEVIQLYNEGNGISITNHSTDLITPIDNQVLNTLAVDFNCTAIESENTISNMSLWTNESGSWTRYNITTGLSSVFEISTWTRTFSEGDNILWNCQSCNNLGSCVFGNSNFTFSLDISPPTITLESPTGTLNYNVIGNTETLNVTFTDSNLDTCWYNYNGTNITIDGCLTGVKNSTTFILEENNFNMTIYANDSTGNLNSTFNSWSYTYFENNRTHKNESFETATESFNINVEGATSATLIYNETEYTTTKSGNDFNRTIQIPIGQVGNNSIHWRFDGTQDSFDSFQNVSETVFTLCNSSYTTRFLNISFKDEEDLSIINASIPTSTFEYWLGDGTVTKTLTFINNTDNFNYEFCATPNRTFNFNSLIQYKQGTAYPQRVFSQDSGSLTNETTDLILYLLGVSDGLFVTFQVLNVAEQPISGVDISATRVLEGSDTPVAQGTSDAAGSVTFWLNPDFQHTITFEKTGLDTETLTIFPTQTAYTVSMGGGAVTEPDQTRGVSLVVQPAISFLFNDTIYNFNYTVSSTFWNLEQFGYTLFYSNGTEIDTQLSTASSGGTLSTNANTLNLSWIRMDYYYLINITFTNASRIWYIQTTEGTEYSISNFFERLIIYIDAGMFGFDDFGKALISFLILVLVAGGLTFRYGINSEVAIMGIIFGLVLVLDVGLGLIPNPQLATQAGLENIITIITGIILFGILAKEELR